MKSLGKIVIFLTIFLNTLYAGVVASVSPQTAYIGDVVQYSLKVDGEDIKEPIIYDLCGEKIISTGSRTNIEMINGDYKKTRTLVYQFIAKKTCTIEPLAVAINGKIENSNSVELTVKKESQKIGGADFQLQYDVPKTDLYVGESIPVTLTLKQKRNVPAVDSKFFPSDFKGFWQKGEPKQERTENGQYLITKVYYKLAPQREGNLTISPAELRIASQVQSQGWGMSFMPQMQWKSYFSNEVSLDVKPLPNNAKLIGDFSIEAKADKTTVHPNEVVNVIVTVKGEGNLEDIESFKPHINGVNVFDEKIEIVNNVLTQKLVFVGDHDFTIRPFTLAYFDTQTKQLKQIHTQPIEVKVEGAVTKTQQPLTIKKESAPVADEAVAEPVVEENNNYVAILFAFIVGIFIGIVGMILKDKVVVKKQNTQKFSFKDEKLLLIKLLPYKDIDEEVKHIVVTLEKNLYSNEKEKIEKAKLKEIIKKYDIR